MPTPTLDINGHEVPVKDALTKLLNLANDFRAALGGQRLAALPSSVRRDPRRCIIANALNFDCSICPGAHDSGRAWFKTREQAERFLTLTEQTAVPEQEQNSSEWVVPLPPALNAIAQAFDEGALPVISFSPIDA